MIAFLRKVSPLPLHSVTLSFSSLLPLDRQEPFLLGISGGADSVALLYLLLEQGYEQPILCHFNHLLRGAESDEDASFVEKLAQTLHLPYELGQEDVHARALLQRCSLETAAREARYAFFASVAQKRGLHKLLLAHHANDQVETCLFNFLRGTGSAGLAGMQKVSERKEGTTILTLFRPLLALSKKELLAYLEGKKISFRHDSSNDTLLPTRNRLRHCLVPLLDKIFGTSYFAAILRTSLILGEENDYLESLASPLAKRATLPLEELQKMHLALRRRVIHAWLRHHHFSEVGFAEVTRVASLLDLNHAAQINLPQKRHAYRQKGEIHLTPPKGSDKAR